MIMLIDPVSTLNNMAHQVCSVRADPDHLQRLIKRMKTHTNGRICGISGGRIEQLLW